MAERCESLGLRLIDQLEVLFERLGEQFLTFIEIGIPDIDDASAMLYIKSDSFLDHFEGLPPYLNRLATFVVVEEFAKLLAEREGRREGLSLALGSRLLS